jgi:hypothetical protein
VFDQAVPALVREDPAGVLRLRRQGDRCARAGAAAAERDTTRGSHPTCAPDRNALAVADGAVHSGRSTFICPALKSAPTCGIGTTRPDPSTSHAVAKNSTSSSGGTRR